MSLLMKRGDVSLCMVYFNGADIFLVIPSYILWSLLGVPLNSSKIFDHFWAEEDPLFLFPHHSHMHGPFYLGPLWDILKEFLWYIPPPQVFLLEIFYHAQP